MTEIQNCFEHLDLAQIIHSEFRSNGVIIWLDRIIQSFPLDCPIKSGNDGNKELKTLSLG